MATAMKEPPQAVDRKFRVTQSAQQVGRWKHPGGFTVNEFISAHPLPPTHDEKGKPVPSDIVDRAGYHGDLIERLIVLGKIEETEDDLPPTPENPRLEGNSTIKQSIEEWKRDKQAKENEARSGAAQRSGPAPVSPPQVIQGHMPVNPDGTPFNRAAISPGV